VRLRNTLPLLLLTLGGCATTAIEPVDPPAPEPALAETATPSRSFNETIDDHLFVPDLEEEAETPAPDVEKHVHVGVWERLTHSYALPECSDHEANRDWARWYGDRPEYMARVFKRAQPWIHYIAGEIEKRGMPGELALLPIVESAYDPFAYSRGAAMGAWQFIASTGRRFGLQQDWWYDGRRDVWSSTQAALDYLEYLNNMFEGDWLLALAAYNSGEGRVSREVKKNVKAGKPADFWNIRLPKETRGYVPKLLGLACLTQYPEEYDFRFPATPDRPVIAAVDPGVQTDLVLVSQIADVDIDVLFSLNPGYNRWATSPAGPYRVVLPVEGARKLEARLEAVDASTLMKWDQVTVQDGDTLSDLANKHSVPIDVIRTANRLDGDMIRAGQKLRLPRDEQLLVDPLYASAAAELQKLQSGLIASDRLKHTVRSGESLSVIAKRYRVSVRELQAWNSISNPHKLRAGQQLVVFQSPAPAPAVRREGTVQHTVQSGDSLWSIARRYKVKLNDLMRWNDLGRNDVIRPGQSLKIVF
jgi:membrane-bound lytic murein transglycosylase D